MILRLKAYDLYQVIKKYNSPQYFLYVYAIYYNREQQNILNYFFETVNSVIYVNDNQSI